MKRNLVRLMLMVATVFAVLVVLESQADARLFGRRGGGHRHHRCHQQVCCEPAPTCCEPAPVEDCGGCEAAPADCGCESDCGCNNGRGHRRHHRHNGGGCNGGCHSGCNGGCGGCDSGCGGGCGGEVVGEVIVPAESANGGPSPAAPEAPAEQTPATPPAAPADGPSA